MSPSVSLEFRNGILSRLSTSDLELFRPDLEAVHLPLRQRLEDSDQPISHAYFPADGLASVVAVGPDKRETEVGIIGREGMTAMAVVLGNDQTPNESFMQIAGSGHRIGVTALRMAMSKSETLRNLLLRYMHSATIQMSHTALANSRVKVEARLARWLLMAHDRIDGNVVELTHEFLALMLGVRRAGVTQALQVLEGQKTIRAMRGKITIVNRKALETAANGSYGVPEAEYARLMAEPT